MPSLPNLTKPDGKRRGGLQFRSNTTTRKLET